MFSNNRKYKVNEPNVIHEMIDGEVVIVNMETGHYYSLTGAGAEIWAEIAAGMSKDEIVYRLAAQYEAERKNIEQSVNDLIAELRDEEMIIPTANEDEEESAMDIGEKIAPQSEKRKFEIPILRKYTDMEELLLLDPIHEVDESGWPNMARDASENGKII